LQYDDFGNPYIVTYYSRTTTAAMKKWSPYSLELSAIALTLKAFENVLGGLEIHIMSDNAVCVNINAFKPTNNREKRLIAYLMGFDCTYHYVKGRENILADCLSRLSEDLDSDQISQFLPTEKATEDDFILPILQCIPEETQPDTQNEQSEAVPDPDVPVKNERQWFIYKFQILPNKNQKLMKETISYYVLWITSRNISLTVLCLTKQPIAPRLPLSEKSPLDGATLI